MSRASLEVVKCDRCGTSDQFAPADAERTKWAIIQALTRGDVPIAGNADDPADLCPKCADELEAWLKAG